ncbi:MAG: acylphosphatase [Candidatus Caldarchaeum sp.]|nr:acylphosphatase [Candidatus Caldarchaeum sp.]MDW8063404.1 acylphosphatase [Candidatus Caldarchaeum sp.]
MENVIQRAEITVDGVVQGVGFRYYVRRTARRFSVLGYVQNLDDGTVKITCEGRLSSIEKFAEALRNAPPPIQVEKVTVTFKPATGEFKTFKIVVGDLTEEMVEGFATGAAYFEVMFHKQDQALSKMDLMLEKQDKLLEKQDIMLEKQDKMLVKMDQMLEKQDLMLEKQDVMIEKQEKMLQKQDLMLDKQDKMLEKQDKMLEKQDKSLEKQGLMIAKQDKMIEKQDVIVERQDEMTAEVKGLRRDLSIFLEDRLLKIERDIEAIKAKIGLS